MKEKASTYLKSYAMAAKSGSIIGSFRNDSKVYKARLNRVSELALVKAVSSKSIAPYILMNAEIFAPVKNMIKRIEIAGINLTVDASLPSFQNDPFILEKTEIANLNFSNKG